jgi:hypothetical protein
MSEISDALKRADRNKLAALLSVFPGAGHLLKKQTMLGLIIMTGGNILMVFIAVWLSLATVGLSLVLLPILWVLGVAVSAYFVPDRTGHTSPPRAVPDNPPPRRS